VDSIGRCDTRLKSTRLGVLFANAFLNEIQKWQPSASHVLVQDEIQLSPWPQKILEADVTNPHTRAGNIAAEQSPGTVALSI
jgi:hypothetical protein